MKSLLLLMALITTRFTFCQSDWHTKVIENNISVKLPDNATYNLSGKSGAYSANTSNNLFFVLVQYDVLPRYSDIVQLPESTQQKLIKVFMDNAIKGALKFSGNEKAVYKSIFLKELIGRESTYFSTNPLNGERTNKTTKMFYAHNKVISFTCQMINNSTTAESEAEYFFSSIHY